MAEIDFAVAQAWLDANVHTISETPTEISIPVVEGVSPCYRRDVGPSWSAYLATVKIAGAFDDFNDRGYITECDHGHPSPEDARACAHRLALALAVEIAAAHRG